MKYAVVSCSLNVNSRSRILAKKSLAQLHAAGLEASWFDVSQSPIPSFDNDQVFENDNFKMLYNQIKSADGVIIASPVYNWSLSAVAKQIVEATGATGQDGRTSAWFDKVITFLCAGGLPHAYLSYSDLAMSMVIDFKCILNPYMVYACDADWQGEDIKTDEVNAQLTKTIEVKRELVELLGKRTYKSKWGI